jgi:branched-chain amino acid aminotransferase
LAKEELGKEVIERPIDRSELFVAEEVFTTGTACNISAITQINGQRVGEGKIGPLTRALRELYFRIVKEEGKYSYLITTV